MNFKRISLISLLILTLMAGWFYWFQWRPSKIREDCYTEAKKKAVEKALLKVDLAPGEPSETTKKTIIEHELYERDIYENEYKMCLSKKGLTYKDEQNNSNNISNKTISSEEIKKAPLVKQKAPPNPDVIEPNYAEQNNWIEKNKIKRQQECQEKINKYNICMNEYNAKMADYNSCLSETNNPDSIKYGWYCHKPTNTCFKPLSCN